MPYPAKTDATKILAAAVALLARDGLRGMTIRAVAASLELAPNAIYRYYRDHAHLEAAVGAEVSRVLHVSLRQAVHGRKPEGAIRAIAATYWEFARDNKLLYEALLIPRPAEGEEALEPEQLWLFFVGHVARIAGEAQAPKAAVALWAFLHGIAALQTADLLGAEKPAEGADFGLQAWLDSACALRESDT